MRLRVAIGLIPALLAGGVLALSAGGCGSSSAVALDPVAQAADVTSNAGGAHIWLSARVSAPTLPSALTIGGEGFFNYRSREGQLSVDLAGLPANALASASPGPLHLQEIFKSATIYVGGSLLAGKLPGGAHWLKLDLSRLGGLGLDPQQLAGGESNPAQLLDYLKAGGSVAVVGHEPVRGTETTHYHGSLELARIAASLPSSERARARKAVAELTARTGVSTLPVDVWVDGKRLVRRARIDLAATPTGQELHLTLTIELFDFGQTPTVAIPAPAETYDLTGSTLARLGIGGG